MEAGYVFFEVLTEFLSVTYVNEVLQRVKLSECYGLEHHAICAVT
jgi:hypothetical protein